MGNIQAVVATFLCANLLLAQEVESTTNCSFRSEPDRFLSAQSRAWRETNERATHFTRALNSESVSATAAPSEIPQRGYIDYAIFSRLEKDGIRSAKLTTDYEFVRRIFLDLTGRIPAPQQVRDFVADADPNKRERLIDSLLASPEFTDRWMLWLGDLMQNSANNSTQPIQVSGRNAYHQWLLKKFAADTSLRDLVWEAIVSKGNNYSEDSGGVNWNVRSRVGNGPIQDSYDNAFSRAATQFLGMSHYDCLLCHNGRGRLDSLSVWGKSATRLEAQKMAAYHSRTRFASPARANTDQLFLSWDVTEATTGTYDLNTTSGNRPNRTAYGTVRNLTPEYRDGTPGSGDWRAAFATKIVTDPMFAKNIANRIWKQVFNLALAEPLDQLDPARLDPDNAPPAPWTYQTSHPELLNSLAKNLEGVNFSVRSFVRILVTSSAYQLSSRYDDTWKLDSVPLFARHYPRRLEGEEIHDSIQSATGILGTFTVRSWTEPIRWAMKSPEPAEGLSSGNFMNAFFRGNRDTQERTQQGSILQQLNLMNDAVVLSRAKVAASPELKRLVAITNLESLADEVFLTFLSRLPSTVERAKTVKYLTDRGAAARNSAVEDLTWAMINRSEFIFSY